MRAVEKTARTIDDAITAALKELGVSREDVEVKVLEEPKQGLLGLIGSRPGRVLVTEKEKNIDRVRQFLGDVLGKMDLVTSLEAVEEDDTIRVDIKGEGLGVIIGKRGQTLDSLQYLTNIVANKAAEKRMRVIIDAEGYRKRREEVLVDLAKRLAERVRRNGERIMLEPMSAQERKVIHTALQDNPYVTTRSEGEDPFRKVVILSTPK